jgi:hypothetical protein
MLGKTSRQIPKQGGKNRHDHICQSLELFARSERKKMKIRPFQHARPLENH